MTKETAKTVLDHIEKIVVPGDVFKEPTNEYWALKCLEDGMELLYRQVANIDEIVRKRINPDGTLRGFFYGNHPAANDIPTSLLTCLFHWYAISACQYVRTVGAIAYQQDARLPKPNKYVEQVIPEVKVFRDKIAAHFSWSARFEHQGDNDAERFASIIPPLSFENDSYHVGGMNVTCKRNGKISVSSRIKPWSLCRVHERLRQRYWPKRTSRNE